WIARFLAGATPGRAAATAADLNGLLGDALAAHEELMALAGCGHRLRRTGYLKAFRTDASFRRNAGERALLERFGIAHTVYGSAGLRELEPHLSAIFRHGVLVTDSASVDDPGAVTRAYADLVCDAGAGLVTARVQGLSAGAEGYTLHTDRAGDIAADRVVVAAGAWSGAVLAHLGVRVPLAAERGYHRRFGFDGNQRLARPVHDVEGNYVMTCMEMGVQVSTGMELAAVDAPSTDRQLKAVEAAARTAFAFDRPVAPPWRGARPALPDGRPMIGPVPGRPGLWCAFGHGHIGFTTGPVTGRLLAEAMVTGATPPVLAPFAPGRYLRG
ncbi:MAG: FAD-binding oxidoreductase, partial [Rhodospirillaceae bacterium]|nr:FAD-binding oxidoreductase [Rhodospirillaceae bacterium]